METVVVIVIISAAAVYMIRSLYRSASVGKKSCGCEGGCPISDRCAPKDNRCALNEPREEVLKR